MIISTATDYSDAYGSLIFMLGLFAMIALAINIPSRSNKSTIKKFHEKERRANMTDFKPLPSDLIFTVDLTKINYTEFQLIDLDKSINDKILYFNKRLLEFKDLPYVFPDDTTSNIDIKLEYGPVTLQKYIQYEQNYIAFTKLLINFSDYLVSIGLEKQAKTLLVYLVELKSSVSAPYITLSDIYFNEKDKNALINLRTEIENNNIFKNNPYGEKKVLEKLSFYIKSLM